MVRLEDIYSYFPAVLQNMIVSGKGIELKKRRFDSDFFKIYKNIAKTYKFDYETLQEYKKKRLKEYLKYTYKNSEYFNCKINEYNIDLDSPDITREIKKLPILSKSKVKENLDNISIQLNSNEELITSQTSGTTGSGLIFKLTSEAEKYQWATWWRYRKKHGIKFNEWCGYFGGRRIVSINQKNPPYWRYNYPGKQLMFSAYHLKEENIRSYVSKLREQKIKWIHGYPSLILVLANYMIERKVEVLDNLEIITVGAENLLEFQKKRISNAFKVPIRQHYGQAEGVANISECEYGNLHVDEDFSFIEFIQLKEHSNKYKIIGTNWHNRAFPLLRYDTGDIVELKEGKCKCGYVGRLVKNIDGRKEDYIVLPTGEKMGRLDHIFKNMTNIHAAQIYQKRSDRIEIRVVKGDGYKEVNDEGKLIKNTRKYLGEKIKIKIKYRNSLKRTSTGKLRLVISNL